MIHLLEGLSFQGHESLRISEHGGRTSKAKSIHLRKTFFFFFESSSSIE